MPGDRVGRELARNVSTECRVGEQTVEGAAGGPQGQRECGRGCGGGVGALAGSDGRCGQELSDGFRARMSHRAVNLCPRTQAVILQQFTSLRVEWGWEGSWGSCPYPRPGLSAFSRVLT